MAGSTAIRMRMRPRPALNRLANLIRGVECAWTLSRFVQANDCKVSNDVSFCILKQREDSQIRTEDLMRCENNKHG